MSLRRHTLRRFCFSPWAHPSQTPNSTDDDGDYGDDGDDDDDCGDDDDDDGDTHYDKDDGNGNYTDRDHDHATVRARNQQETQRSTCDAAREPKTTQSYTPRSMCTQSLLHGLTRLGYFEPILVALRGHGVQAFHLLCSSLLLVFPFVSSSGGSDTDNDTH